MPTNPEEDKQLQESVLRGYEASDMRVRRIFLAAIAMSIIVPIIVLFVWLHFRILAGPTYRGFVPPSVTVWASRPTHQYPPPQLILNPGRALEQLRAEQMGELNSYGWMSPTQQVVRIPVARAMELIAEQGLPVRRPGTTNLGPSGYELIIQRRLERDREMQQQRKQEGEPGVSGQPRGQMR